MIIDENLDENPRSCCYSAHPHSPRCRPLTAAAAPNLSPLGDSGRGAAGRGRASVAKRRGVWVGVAIQIGRDLVGLRPYGGPGQARFVQDRQDPGQARFIQDRQDPGQARPGGASPLWRSCVILDENFSVCVRVEH